jgi:hypothetical protein
MQHIANRSPSWRPRREKVFQNYEERVPLDREAKVRITRLAEVLSQRTEKGKHWGILARSTETLQYA